MTTDITNERNPGIDFNPDWLAKVQVNRSAVERRAASLGDRRSIKKHWQVAWLLQAISCIDLTTLSGDDTPGRVRRLCNKAMNPVRREILCSLGLEDLELTTGAVCVYHGMLETANQILTRNSGRNARRVGLAAVSAGFPAGLNALPLRIAEIDASVAAGATEIDIV
ncbi:MAG: deoxyribose-phosphate aldolase, partial [Proteobacteria bacterium]|nr:deoxyribose-phosphate aldolase [Pseudomonadota bacterium]